MLIEPKPPIKWPTLLTPRRGSKYFLADIDVWHDFDWDVVFKSKGRSRTHFKHGRRLALLVKEEAKVQAPGKVPALVLTTSADAEEGPLATASHYVVVVRIDEYLRLAAANPAVGYFALRIRTAITAAGRLRQVVSDDALFQTMMEDPAAFAAFAAWAQANARQFAALADVLANSGVAVPAKNVDMGVVLKALSALDRLDGDVLAAVVSLMERGADKEAKISMIEAVTADTEGRNITSVVWGRRIAERMNDALRITREYENLIRTTGIGETPIQEYIAAHPWVIGLEYLRVRVHPQMPRGTADFLLERYDGYHDLLELKRPSDPIINVPLDDHGAPASPSGYSLSAPLAQAIAQAHAYRRQIRENGPLLSKQYGLNIAHDPCCFIVIGTSQQMNPHERELLDDLNESLHRVEIVPFDLLGERSRRFLTNLSNYLDAGELDQDPPL